jgi:phosphatidylserine/phosphatidylglycerophosphate/cardiolipin synthase-like enzyme
MTLITRFRENRPLPNSLYRQINSHFKYYWARNRISEVESGNEFISALPRTVKRGIVVHYLFDDVFYNFRFFFNPNKYKDSKFLHDVAFGLRPRHFSDD